MSKNPKFKTYITGFILSLIFTLTAYKLVDLHVNSGHLSLPHEMLIPILLTLAVGQFLIQSVFFLHLSNRPKSRWSVVFFAFTITMILTVVVGSVWIMTHLNYNMSQHDMNMVIQSEEAIHK